MSVLVYIENTEGSFKKSVFEVVSYAKATADLLNTRLTAISIGDVSASELENIGNYGASKVLTVNNEKLKSFDNQAYAAVLAEATKAENANVVVLSNSFSGKGLAPRLATKLEAAFAGNAISLPEVNGEGLSVKRVAFSSKAFAITELEASIKVIALNPNAFEVREVSSAVVVEEFKFGGGHAFLFFTVMMIIQIFVVWKYFPETKGKTLEALGEELSGKGNVGNL